MKFLVFILLAIDSFYLLTYAKHCWNKKSKTAAVGLTLLALGSFFFPSALIIVRW